MLSAYWYDDFMVDHVWARMFECVRMSCFLTLLDLQKITEGKSDPSHNYYKSKSLHWWNDDQFIDLWFTANRVFSLIKNVPRNHG